MEKELLVKIVAKAKKAADMVAAAGEVGFPAAEERCLDALQQLKKIRATRELLLAAHVAHGVQQLINHPRKRIRALSREVVLLWKRMAAEDSIPNRNNGCNNRPVNLGGKTGQNPSGCQNLVWDDSKKQGEKQENLGVEVKPVPVGRPRNFDSLPKTNGCNRPVNLGGKTGQNPSSIFDDSKRNIGVEVTRVPVVGPPMLLKSLPTTNDKRRDITNLFKVADQLTPVVVDSFSNCMKLSDDSKKQGEKRKNLGVEVKPVPVVRHPRNLDSLPKTNGCNRPVNLGGETGRRNPSECQNLVSDVSKKQKQENLGVEVKPLPVGRPWNLDSLPKTNDKRRDIIQERIAESLFKVADEVVHDDQNLKEVFVLKNGCNGPVNLGGETSQNPSECENIMADDSKKQGEKKQENLGVEVKQVPVRRRPQNLDSVPKTNDKRRDIIRERIAESLFKVADEVNDDDQNLKEAVAACDPIPVAVTVESELFKTWGQYNGPNKFKYTSLMFNIKDDKNPDFRRKVLLGVFPLDEISQLSTEDMGSDSRRLEIQKIKERTAFYFAAAQPSSLVMKCGNCKKSQNIYHQKHTRTPEEPTTTFVTCLKCNHHWKFS